MFAALETLMKGDIKTFKINKNKGRLIFLKAKLSAQHNPVSLHISHF